MSVRRSFIDHLLFFSQGIIYSGAFLSFAELPPNLPGEEITKELFEWSIPRDSIGAQKVSSQKKDTLTWYDRAAKTWQAPPLAEQMSSEKKSVPMGKGGIFVPRFTQANDEPDIEIMATDGVSIKSGEPGQTFSVEPGTYFVFVGSGSHRQRMVRQVDVVESKTTPVMPDWAGLNIETVDSTTIAFRGEYELIRIDEFEPFGRGFGADPELGEKVKTWIVRPGTYKILGRGEGYNNLKNFITVRLLPGELVNVLLIQRQSDMAIISGGTVDMSSGTRITSNWTYGANVGCNLQFSGKFDKHADRTALNSDFSLRTGLWLRYNNHPIEWESNALLDEGISLSEDNFEDVITAPDDFRVISLFIWRFVKWAGPYARAEMRTNLLPNRIRRDDTKLSFCILRKDSTVKEFDTSISFQSRKSLCPLKVDLDIGANVDAISFPLIELKLRGGIGSSFNDFPNRFEYKADTNVAHYEPKDADRVRNSMIMLPLDATQLFEFGPQGSATGNLRFGRFGTAGGEIRVFAPVVPEMRFTRPDFDLTLTLSWRLAQSLTLDYDYTYTLKQPEDKNARENYNTHKIYLRFSYSSR
jgi:hypothetical protein